jgi:hypothetical protein
MFVQAPGISRSDTAHTLCCFSSPLSPSLFSSPPTIASHLALLPTFGPPQTDLPPDRYSMVSSEVGKLIIRISTNVLPPSCFKFIVLFFLLLHSSSRLSSRNVLVSCTVGFMHDLNLFLAYQSDLESLKLIKQSETQQRESQSTS